MFAEDFEGAVHPAIGGADAVESAAGLSAIPGFGTRCLRNTSRDVADATRLTLTGLPAHDAISIDVLLLIIDTWDGEAGGPNSGDFFSLKLDGASVFRYSCCIVAAECAAGAVTGVTPVDTPAITGQNVTTPPGDGRREFGLGYADWPESGWDMSAASALQNIARTASTAIILFYGDGAGYAPENDEFFGIDALSVSVRTSDVPAPAAAPLLPAGLGALAALRHRR